MMKPKWSWPAPPPPMTYHDPPEGRETITSSELHRLSTCNSDELPRTST